MDDEKFRLEEVVRFIFKGLIPIVFLAAGVSVLFLRIPGWSILLGAPLTIFGAVFLIFTYDEVVSSHIYANRVHKAYCSICGRTTVVIDDTDDEDVICLRCKRDIRKGILKES